jgi:hypothetical protein
MNDLTHRATRKRGAAAAAGIVAATLAALVFLPSEPAMAKKRPKGPKVPGTTCPMFPKTSWWAARVNKLPVHKRSADWMANMQPDQDLHPDFGPSFGAIPVPYGIPITIVGSGHAKVTVDFDYASESDHVGYPLGNDTLVEGGQWDSGDRHTVVVDRDTCRLYETWATHKDGNTWTAGSGATWNLNKNRLRKDGWTSADAAGLPILPGLLNYNEVAKRKIRHAIRFTTNVTDRSYLWPARHQAGSVDDPSYPPMGARFRLKRSYKISKGLRPDTRAILKAMKRYGMVLADNGSAWYFQGTSDERWPNDLLDELKQIPASAFEAVDTSGLRIKKNSMKVRKKPKKKKKK